MIFNFLKNRWFSISRFGLNENMLISEQKKLILTNQTSLLLFAFLFTLTIIVSILSLHADILRDLTILLILIIPYLNKKGYYRLTSFLMSIVFPINVLIFSAIIKINFNGIVDIVYYFIPRFLILGGLIIPLILIDWKHRALFILAISVNFICLLSYDFVNNLFGVGINNVQIVTEKYSLINIFIFLPYFFILFGFFFLQNINNKYEKKILELLEEIKFKNSALESQNDEIIAQRDEIESQRDIVTQQKEHIEEVHKDLTDSINYAERIQRSFLATKELLDENLNEYFVLFHPKDVVSGDFYWAGILSTGNFALATADSTGHGVPGAIMSILNISSLEKAIESGLNDPSEILNRTRQTIITRLKKDGSADGGKDGMDASLICFDFEKMRLTYSAANNPVWIIRNNSLIELEPDKMPVGKHDNDKTSFTQQEFQLQIADVIYTLTDGFQDQFGGPKGKKFMTKNLKQLLIENCHLSMNEQKQNLEKTLADWIGDGEQIDDITILGIKI